MIPVKILGTGSALPRRVVSTDEVIAAAMPGRDAAKIREKVGISQRHWTDDSTTAAKLGADALREALQASGLRGNQLQRLIFVSSTSGDCLIPATANAVARELGLSNHIGCLDVNNACTGFVTALDLGARLVATGVLPVGIVVAERFSQWISPEEPRSYVVMGDASAAVVLGASDGQEGMLASEFGNDSRCFEAATLAHGEDGHPSWLHFGWPARRIAEVAISDIRQSTMTVLQRVGIEIDEVQWAVLHQPNGSMYDTFLEVLGIPEDRSIRIVQEIGSVGAASVGVGLDRLWRSTRLQKGDRVLIAAVGGGSSCGALLLKA